MARNPGNKLEEWVVAVMSSLYEDAKRRKMSGALHEEGDATAGPFEFECKDNPNQKSLSVSEKDWLRTLKVARKAAKIPAFVNVTRHGHFVTLRWEDFYNLLDENLQLHRLHDRTQYEDD